MPLLSVENLSISFRGSYGWVRALHNFNLDIALGESLGVVGESGSGKSVTWLGVLGLLPSARVEGSALMGGTELIGLPERKLASWRGKRIATIFQDPTSSLNPVHRIGRQIAESLSLHQGLSGAAARTEARRFLERVHIPDAAQKLNAYSLLANATVTPQCSVTSPNTLNFGSVVSLGVVFDAQTTLSVSCSNQLPYTVGLSSASGSNPTSLQMAYGTNRLSYAVYQDSARTTGWGNVSGLWVAGTGTASSQSFTVYGRLPVQTLPPAGTYTDTISVTVTY